MITELVILTQSMMKGGYCVTGICVNPGGLNVKQGEFIRLVSDKYGAPLRASHLTYDNASEPCRPLDRITIDIAEHVPCSPQTENNRIKAVPCSPMHKLGECTIDEVMRLHPLDADKYIFLNTSDKIDEWEMRSAELKHSLMLIQVGNLSAHDSRADFFYNGIAYRGIRITDQDYTRRNFSLKQAYLVISLPKDPYTKDGLYYKFIAKIFPA